MNALFILALIAGVYVAFQTFTYIDFSLLHEKDEQMALLCFIAVLVLLFFLVVF